jgi:hypothetical protein
MEENIQQGAQAPSLGVKDLLLMFQVIQVVAQRGAFRADEMSNVGSLHDRLKSFLISAGALPSAESGPSESPAEEPKE